MKEAIDLSGLEFQFLIGSLRTVDQKTLRSWEQEFQFLIGSLRTHHGGQPAGHSSGFNSS